MKVWVVTKGYPYEGEDPIGVFSSNELATEFINKQKDINVEYGPTYRSYFFMLDEE